MKPIRELLNSLFNDKNDEISSLTITPDADGLGLEFSESNYSKLASGEGDDLGLHQFLAMNSILEEGIAEKIPTGVYLSSENAVRLDENFRHLFELPPTWNGSFSVEQSGLTYDSNFKLKFSSFRQFYVCNTFFHFNNKIIVYRIL